MPKINFTVDQVLESFVHQMVVDKGLAEEDRKQNGKIQHELMEQVNEAIERAMIEALPDAELVELNRLLDEGADDEKVEAVFTGAGVNFEVAAGKAMAKFRADYLGEELNAEDSTMTNDNTVHNDAVAQSPEGRPVQGETSEVPGRSDVEGVAKVEEER